MNRRALQNKNWPHRTPRAAKTMDKGQKAMPLATREGDQLKPNPLQSRSAYKLSCRRGGEKGAAGRDGRMGRTGENRRGGGSG